MKNRWFILNDLGNFNGSPFSFFSSTNESDVKYEILEMKFKIVCCLQWFVYSWRRREGENVSYLYALPEIYVTLEEIFEIPLFQTIEEKATIEKAKMIEQIIRENPDVRQAMIEKYAKSLASQIYMTDEASINTRSERFCDFKDIGTKRLFGNKEDDFSRINDIKKCIITAY